MRRRAAARVAWCASARRSCRSQALGHVTASAAAPRLVMGRTLTVVWTRDAPHPARAAQARGFARSDLSSTEPRIPVWRRCPPTRPEPLDPRSRADLLGLESPRKEKEARCHRHRSDHAGRRLRLGEPRDPGRALEGRIVPLPDARFPGAGPPRRKLPDRRRSLCDRIVERDEPGRTQGRGRRSRPRSWSSSAA